MSTPTKVRSLEGSSSLNVVLALWRFGRRSSVGGGSLIICSQEGGIEIGEQVLISWGCTIMDSNAHSLDAAERLNDGWYWQRSAQAGCLGLFKDWTGVRGGPVKIDTGAWVGCNSIILGNVHIGQGAIIGAGSVVTRSVPPFTVFAGNPARFIKLAPTARGVVGRRFASCPRDEGPTVRSGRDPAGNWALCSRHGQHAPLTSPC